MSKSVSSKSRTGSGNRTTSVRTPSLSETIATARTPAQKAAASRRLNLYVREQVDAGKDETQVRAGILAAVTRFTSSYRGNRITSRSSK